MDAELWWNCGTCNKIGPQIRVRTAVVLTLLAVNPCAKMSNLMKGFPSSVPGMH